MKIVKALTICCLLFPHSAIASVKEGELLQKIHQSDLTLLEDIGSENLDKSTFNHINCTLIECIELALENSPIIEESYNQIRSQEKKLLAATRLWMPTFSISADPLIGNLWVSDVVKPTLGNIRKRARTYYERGGNLAQLEDIPTKEYEFTNATYLDIEASLNWNIFDATRPNYINQQTKMLDSYKYLYNLTVRDLINKIQISYAKTANSHDLIRNYKNIIESTSRWRYLAETQYKANIIDLAELSNVNTQYLNVISAYLKLKDEYTSNTFQLAKLIGIKDGAVSPKDMTLDVRSWPNNLNETLKLAEENNEEYKSLMAQSDALEAEARALKLSFVPKFFAMLSGTYSFQRGFLDSTFSPNYRSFYVQDSSEWEGVAGIGFRISFDGGQSMALSSASGFQAKAKRNQAENSKINNVAFVKTAYSKLVNGFKRVDIANQAVREAENAVLVYTTTSTLGISDVTKQIQAINLYTESVMKRADAYLETKKAESNLIKATMLSPYAQLIQSNLF